MNKKRILGLVFILACICIVMWPQPCHHDIPCLVDKNPWLQARFNKGLPLFMATKPTSGLNAEQRALPDTVWSLLAEQEAAFETSHRQLQQTGPISCAVVANGITLLGSGYGKLIDSHSYVFRMNNAPLKGYEKDVGTKTTFNVLQSGIDSIKNYGPDTYAVIWGKFNDELIAPSLLQWVGESAPDAKIERLNIESPRTQRLLIFHRALFNNIETAWFTPTDIKTGKEWAGTGFRTIILALHLCDQVDLFGFGPDANNHWWHYYDEGSQRAYHRLDFQEQLIDRLAAEGIVQHYKGKLDQPN